MLYPLGSALVSGVAMFVLGQNTAQKASNQPQAATPPAETATLAKGIHATNTFTEDAITPIIRKIKMNDYCNITYSTLHKAPLAVHEFLDKNVITGNAERAPKFFTDPNIKPEKFAVSDNYYTDIGISKNFQCDRGHMAGASNYNSKQDLKTSTFTLANTVPQNQYNNRGIWNTFERYSRSLLLDGKCQTLEIISGPIFYSDIKDKDHPEVYHNQQVVFKENGIVMPPQLYKIIKCNTNNGYSYASAFKFKNSQTFDNDKTLAQFSVPIEEIEDKTGLVFNLKSAIIGSLIQYDPKGTSTTKQVYDTAFFTDLMLKETTIEGMNGVKSRAYFDNGIKVNPEPHADKINGMAAQELDEMNNPDYTNCRNLFNYLRFSKDFYYLKNFTYDPYKDRIHKEIDDKIQPCQGEDDDRYKQYIRKRIYAGGSYKYPHQDKLQTAFPKL